MKKLLFIALALFFIAGLYSCNGEEPEKTNNTAGQVDDGVIIDSNEKASYEGYPEFISAPISEGNRIFVSPENGDFKNDGSFEQPYKTLTQALSNAEAGDTIYLRGGSYTEAVNISNIGNENAWITIRAYNDEKPVFTNASGGLDSCIVILPQSRYIRIMDIEISGFLGAGVWIKDGAENIYIENMNIHDISTAKFTQSGTEGILGAGKNVLVRNCEIYDIGKDRMVQLDHGMYVGGIENWVIDSNTIYNSPGAGIQQYCGGSESPEGNNVYITNNVIKNCKYGITLSSCENFYISNNDILNVNYCCFYITSYVKNCIIQNNILYSSYTKEDRYLEGKWNAISIKRMGVASNIIVCNDPSLYSGNTFTNNMYFQNLNPGIYVSPNWGTPEDISELDIVNTYDAFLSADPLFESFDEMKLALQQESPALGSGIKNEYTPSKNKAGEKNEATNIGAY